MNAKVASNLMFAIAFSLLLTPMLGYSSSKFASKRHDGFSDFDKFSIAETNQGGIKWLYDQRLTVYDKATFTIAANVYTLAALCLLTIFLLKYFPKDVKLPFLSMEVPSILVFVILPVLLMYNWLQFGFAFFSAIDSRVSLFILGKLNERLLLQTKVPHEHSSLHSLEDGLIVDTWANLYLGHYPPNGIFETVAISVALFGFFAGLLGLTHACTIAALLATKNSFAHHARTVSAVTVAAVVVIAVSHFAFVAKFSYGFAFCFAILIYAAVFLRVLSKYVDRRILPQKLQDGG